MKPRLTKPKPLPFRLLMLTAVCQAGAAAAQPAALPFNPAQTIEQWSQVLYCQKAYAHPDNLSRVYGYDIEQCAAAEASVLAQIARFPDTVQADMQQLAQQQTKRIMANTRDVTQVLGACRQTCTRMAALAPEPPQAEPEPGDPTATDHSPGNRP